MNMDENRLCFIVREPYKSPNTNVALVAGIIEPEYALSLESQMPEDGVIFSDGILEDYLEFNSGKIVTIGVSGQRAQLIS